jgi:cytochrome c oxidase cbb3-type subunit 3
MTGRVVLFTVWQLASLLCTVGCGPLDSSPGRIRQGVPVISPDQVTDFALLYSSNCSGCHGQNGEGGLAIGLNSPVYLAIADDATIRRITAEGVPGTAMPAFAQHSGGMLTDNQVNLLIGGMRSRWAKPDALHGASPPPYRAQAVGNADRGASVYGIYCSSCHGVDGKGGRASSIVDSSYLKLVSDQNLRTTVIVGRAELGAPDWRENVPGKPMTPEDVSDVLAWLGAKRRQFPGQPHADVSELRGVAQ